MKAEEIKKEAREKIYQHLIKIKSAQDIFDLFKLLGYPHDILFDISSKRKKTSFDFKKEDEERINEIYSLLSFDEKLPVFLLETTTTVSSFIRSVTNTFDKQYLQFLLIFVTDYSEIVFVFPDKEKIEAGKHKLRLTKLIVDKEDIASRKEYYSVIETLANIRYENEASWRDIWRKWKKAFSVERVTNDFFEDYKTIFFILRNELNKQKIPGKEAHEFTLQALNRIMFIYFISKKKWLEQQKFIEWLWTSYRNLGKFGSDDFYEKWLKQIFLKAFNNRAYEIKGFPDDVVKVISSAPYLNGGLFRENGLDSLKLVVTDKMFQRIFDFFEKYNFTIKEDMPLELEVAVDPQMIGYVYESLANVAEEIYDRNDLGIFYTPRVEVDFMCRRSLVEYLSKNLPEIPKEKFYHLIFDLPEEKEKIEKWFAKEKLWGKLEESLDSLSVVDPACGSGAFPVGMLNVIAEIYRIIYRHTNISMTDFQLKNRIIQYSLYGVDVMPWAIHAAELRLWLQLIVETEFKKDELRKNPLLPNLNLNLRIGDSLVQEIGGISFNLRTNNLKPHLKNRLETLRQEKRKYFENSPTAKFKTPEEVRTEEIKLFEEIIDERIENLENEIETAKSILKQDGRQTTLFSSTNMNTKALKKDEQKREERIAEVQRSIDDVGNLKKIKQHLKDPEKKPFVWDIDFAEIFSDKNGFDIVIGNPPYVREEMISPPNKLKAEVKSEDRKEYKKKLIESVQNHFPVIKKIDGKSDYYIYFYFHGLGLLNKNGTFCFISSNSWLDAGYGSELQEFLCKYVPIIAIFDNPKRSFVHADINTIIALFGFPEFKQRSLADWLEGINGGNEKIWSRIQNIAKFVMFKKPFEEVLSTRSLMEIEDIRIKIKGSGIADYVKNVVATPDYRVFPILQEDLLDDGWEYPENYQNGRFKAGDYGGNKWGGKYLRAPEIFFEILKKNQKLISRLGKYYYGERYLNTGGADGFYIVTELEKLDKIYCRIKNKSKEGKEDTYPSFVTEKEFWKPLIKDITKYDKRPIIHSADAWVLNLPLRKTDLKDLKISKYVQWGEEKGFNKRSVTSLQEPWYKPTNQIINACEVLLPRSFNDTFCIFYNPKMYVSLRFFRLHGMKNVDDLFFITLMNTTLFYLFLEIYGSKSLGQGVLDISMFDFLRIEFPIITNTNIKKEFDKISKRAFKPIFEELGINKSKPIRDQEPKPLTDRAELDKIIFDELGLTKEERNEVYWSLCELVKERFEKAKSLSK